MRRSRRGRGSALEFGGSGEDSFVAVVVTKLTGALLFILLLAMVIMALLPKAVDSDREGGDVARSGGSGGGEPLQIATPGTLPDAVAGRPYLVALSAMGGHGRPRWSVDGSLPEWLTLEESTGRIAGTPPKPTEQPVTFQICAWGRERGGPSGRRAGCPALAITGHLPIVVETPMARHRLASLAGAGRGLPGPLAGPPTRA